MNIDTDAVRRLRDNLMVFEQTESPTASGAINAAMIRRVQPFAETMYQVMVADGRNDPAEVKALVAALGVLCGGNLPEHDIATMLAGFDDSAATVEPRIAALGATLSGDRDDRETAFMLAAVVALADGVVETVENSVLELIAEYFGISSRRAGQLLDDVG